MNLPALHPSATKVSRRPKALDLCKPAGFGWRLLQRGVFRRGSAAGGRSRARMHATRWASSLARILALSGVIAAPALSAAPALASAPDPVPPTGGTFTGPPAARPGPGRLPPRVRRQLVGKDADRPELGGMPGLSAVWRHPGRTKPGPAAAVPSRPDRHRRPRTVAASQPDDISKLSVPSPNLIMKPGTTPADLPRIPAPPLSPLDLQTRRGDTVSDPHWAGRTRYIMTALAVVIVVSLSYPPS